MANFFVALCQSSWLWKLAFLIGLCGIACCAAGICTPNFVEAISQNNTRDFKWGLFEYCEKLHQASDWNCEMYPKGRETVYLIVCRYVILAELVCGIFGTFCHFFSPLHRPSCRVKHSVYYFIAGILPGVVGTAVFVTYRKNDINTFYFDVSVSWSLYTTIGACGIFLLAAIFCMLEVRRAHRDRYRGDSFIMN